MPGGLKRENQLLWPGLSAILLLGWLAVSVWRMTDGHMFGDPRFAGAGHPLFSPLYDGWRYRLERPLARFGTQDGGLEILRRLDPKAKLPAQMELGRDGFAYMVGQVGLGGRWKRSRGADLDKAKPPFVVLLHRPAKRYLLVDLVTEDWVVGDDPYAGRVVYPRERFLEVWLEGDHGQLFALRKAAHR